MQINGKEYRLVPVEPDLKMVIAGENYIGRHAWKHMIEAAPSLEAAEAAQDALDAARYRWLRNYEVDSYRACGSKEKLDAEIDAAIAAGGEE